MTAEELMTRGGEYYRLGMRAETEKDWLYWRDRLTLAIQVSRLEFGADVWVTKELEGLLHDLSMRSSPTENGSEATESPILPEDRLGQ